MAKKPIFPVREEKKKTKIWKQFAKNESISLNQFVCRVVNQYCKELFEGNPDKIKFLSARALRKLKKKNSKRKP